MLESLEIRITEPIENYKYEWISAVAHYAVDPDAPANARIADLVLAPRDHDGKVRFSGDVVLLRPADGTNGRAILPVPNRGMVRLPYSGSGIAADRRADRAVAGRRLPARPRVDHCATRLAVGCASRHGASPGLDAPVADVGPGWLRSDFRVDAPSQERPVGDMMPSLGGAAGLRVHLLPGEQAGRARGGAAGAVGANGPVPADPAVAVAVHLGHLDRARRRLPAVPLVRADLPFLVRAGHGGGPARAAGLRLAPAPRPRLRLRQRSVADRPDAPRIPLRGTQRRRAGQPGLRRGAARDRQCPPRRIQPPLRPARPAPPSDARVRAPRATRLPCSRGSASSAGCRRSS